jgi:hypothetical protein
MKFPDHQIVAILRLLCALIALGGPLSANVRINEIMSSNLTTIADEDGGYEDWIELHNPTAVTINLAGWGLSDDPALPFKWTFAAGTSLAPGAHLLVWASGKDRPGQQNTVATPDALGGLVVWLKADSAAFSQGQAVNTWLDSSGKGNHATQPTLSQRPTFSTNAINGLPALNFNRSSSQQLFLPTASFNGMSDLSNFTFLAVARWSGGVLSGLFGGYRGSNTSGPTANIGSTVFEISTTAGGLRLRLPSPIDSTVAGAVTQNQWHLLGASMDQPAAKASMFRNGSVIAEATGNTGTSLLANFERFPIGSSFDNARTFGGQMAEVLMYNRSLSALERASVERYFAAKYNLALQTPSVTSPPHTNFRISSAGESIVLSRPDGSPADTVVLPVTPSDVSYGRPLSDAASWSLLQTPTPGLPNNSATYIEPPAPVVFSHGAGIHSQPFSLSLSHPDPSAVVVYTLDGSDPDISKLTGTPYRFRSSYNAGALIDMSTTSLRYQNPISVVDRSSQPNRISLIPSTSDSNPTYLPVAPVKKATVVRARAYVNGVAGPSAAATYFVSNSNAFNYPLPFVSVFFNERDFFDYDNGIYVAGVDHVTSTGGQICNWGNFNRQGVASERAGRFQLFENGALTLDQGVGFRSHGNCSRRNAFKSLRINADRAYDARDELNHAIFPETVPDATVPGNTAHKSLVLRSPSINDVSFSRLYQSIYGGVGGRLRPVIKFFNGEYWGLSFLRDRLDENYLSHHYDLTADNLALVNIRYGHEVGSTDQRVFDLDHGIPSDMDDFWAMRNFITSNNMAVVANYDQARSLLDMRSFIDHLILKMFAGDDHYAPEYVFWRARTPQDNSFGDGRWRVIVKDFDSTLFTANYVTGLANGTHPRPFGYELFQSLLANPSFRNDFINRFADLLNAHFQPARFQGIINSAYNEVAPVWNEMSARWNNVAFSNPSKPFTVAGRDALLGWSTAHPPRQRGHIRSHFGISSEVNLTVNVSNPAHGHVRVNTIDIKGSTPGLAAQPYPWTGIYFNNIPVSLVANPATGYRFAGWRLNGAGTYHSVAREISLTPVAATSVIAVFEPLSTIHQWDFEHATNFMQPSQSVGGGAAVNVTPGPLTEVLRSSASQSFTTAHLRVNNPLESLLVFSLPSTGFGNLVLSWQTRRSGQGAGIQTISTTTDGVNWTPLATEVIADAAPQSRSFDLTGRAGVENNPQFAVRISFAQGTGGLTGNHRFDNVALSGIALPGGNPAASMVFGAVPGGTLSAAMLPVIQVRMLDAGGLPAVSYNGPVTLSLSGSGSLGGTLTANAVFGTASFSGLSITGIGAFQLIANSPGFAPVQSSIIRSLSLTELSIPQFVQGGVDGVGENNERVPCGWRGRIDGLLPGASYRFANRVVLAADAADSDGAGNMIFAMGPSVNWIRSTASPGFLGSDLGVGHHTFTADSSGSFTGWFFNEPTGNSRFSPGNDVRFRILLNDGSAGQAAAHVLTTSQSSKVIRFGSQAGEGTGIVGPGVASSRRVAVLFADAAGATRPLAIAPVESTGAAVDARYAPFYQILAGSLPPRWGTILPNTLPGGLRRVEIRHLESGDLLDTRVAPQGFASTINPAGGLGAIVLNDDAGLPVLQPGNHAAWHLAENWSTQTIPNAPAATAIVSAPTLTEREIDLNTATTVGTLRFVNQASAFRNRLGSSAQGGLLTLDGGSQAASIRVESSAAGSRVEFAQSLPIFLAGNLSVDDGGHTVSIAGPVSAGSSLIELTKTGAGVMEISGNSPSGAPRVVLAQGTLAISGNYPAALSLSPGSTLVASGTNGASGPISGAGSISLGSSTFSAVSSSQAAIAAVLSQPGGLVGNGVLAHTHPSEPLPIPPRRMDLYLTSSRSPGDRFAGGLQVPSGSGLAAALATTEVRLFVADAVGSFSYLGQTYRLATPADKLEWAVVSLPQGETLEVLQSGVSGNYAQWRNLHFDDPSARSNNSVAGALASTANDGVANLIRYAHGVEPQAPMAQLLPRIDPPNAPGSAAEFCFRMDPSKPDLVWVVRGSGNLQDWSAVLFDSRIHTPPAPDGAGWTRLTIPAGASDQFLRLEVQLVEP